jgi:Putative amidase domain
MIKRKQAVDYAETYWWQPCKDGLVWVKRDVVDLPKEIKKHKGYVAVFLWYPAADTRVSANGMWETLCLVPRAVADKIVKLPHEKRLLSDFSKDAILLASFKDDYDDDNLEVFPKQPPFVGLNDCTHFTSQCLIAGSFPVTKKEATRGAGDLVEYLRASAEVTTLCHIAEHDTVKAVVDSGVVREGDVLAYHTGKKPAHHTVPFVGPGIVTMHTWRASKRPWDNPWDTNMSGERYSLLHFKDDNFKTPEAKAWFGWWKVEVKGDTKRGNPEYYHFGDTGALAVASKAPKDAKAKPDKTTFRWFPVKDTAVVVRRNQMETMVETFTLNKEDPKTAKGAVSMSKATSEVTRVP